ncbi:VIT1/CCC1 transporter family protein [Patescibacteria group bacterium]|nr:VIT1/CCC1 transporter family protein [Patescibacteria group bacterium]
MADLPKAKDTFAEPHNVSTNLRDIILGGQDGLVNVLGIILGLAIASGDLRIILAGGLAATFAESVSMAAVAYTSTRAQQSYYESELEREKREIKEVPELEKEEIREIYRNKGFSGKLLEDVVKQITSNEKVWLDEMMKFELGLQPVETKYAFRSGAVVGLAALVGSLIPLIPFFFLNTFQLQISQAIWVSLVISAITLFIVGAYKAKATVGDWKKSGLEIAVIGTVAALIGYVIGLLFRAPF